MKSLAVTRDKKPVIYVGLFLLGILGILVNANFAQAGTQEIAKNTKKLDGKKIYMHKCMSCHASGSSGAPRFRRQKEWASRIKQSRNILYEHSIQGFGKMEAKGGFPDLSDAEVKAGVDFMLNSLPNPPDK